MAQRRLGAAVAGARWTGGAAAAGARARGLVLGIAVILNGCVTTSGIDPSAADLREAARLNTQLGADYLRSGKSELALEKLHKAVQQDPDYAAAHTTLALVYAARGDAAKAERQFRESLELDADDPQTRNNFGVFLCSQGRREEAVRNFVAAAQSPDYRTPATAWTNAGVCLRREQPQQAEHYLRQALQVAPGHPDALAQLAWLSLRNGDHLQAKGFLQRYEQSGAPATAETLWTGARVAAALGDAAAASRYRQRLLTEFPASNEARELK